MWEMPRASAAGEGMKGSRYGPGGEETPRASRLAPLVLLSPPPPHPRAGAGWRRGARGEAAGWRAGGPLSAFTCLWEMTRLLLPSPWYRHSFSSIFSASIPQPAAPSLRLPGGVPPLFPCARLRDSHYCRLPTRAHPAHKPPPPATSAAFPARGRTFPNQPPDSFPTHTILSPGSEQEVPPSATGQEGVNEQPIARKRGRTSLIGPL